MELKYLEAYVRNHAPEAARRRKLYDYYRGNHEIEHRALADNSKPNNRLACGFPYMISTSYTGYMFGEPVSYTTLDEGLQVNIDAAFRYNDESAENAQLGLDLSVCGIAFELHYIDQDGMERFRRVDPIDCIAIYNSDIEGALSCVIRQYDVKDVLTGDVTTMIEVYDAEKVEYWQRKGLTFKKTGEEPHYYGDVPCVVYNNNPSKQGDFEGVKSLIDAYDLMQSESINEQEYFSDAYLMLQGLMGTTSEDIADMKANRVLLLPTDASAQWLTKSQSDTLVENIKNRLNRDIQRFSGCPDMSDENFSGNSSGVALKYKLLQFENIAGVKEREFKRGLQRRLELLCNIWAVMNRGSYDWRDCNITFKRALPENLLEMAQTFAQLGSLISDETKRSQLPMDIDEETERQRIAEQNEAGMSLYDFGIEDTQEVSLSE